MSCIKTTEFINDKICDAVGDIAINESDTHAEVMIKEFMAIYNIGDIQMRMFEVSEMKLIQGFPVNYRLAGNKQRQKKAIGNSVAPKVPKALLTAMAEKLNEFNELTFLQAA